MQHTVFEERNMLVQCFESHLRKYLYDDNESNQLTAQCLIGYKQLFRGWVMKNLLNVQEFQTIGMGKVNKIIIMKSVEFYSLAWKDRNEVFHNKAQQKQFVS